MNKQERDMEHQRILNAAQEEIKRNKVLVERINNYADEAMLRLRRTNQVNSL